MYFNLTEGLNLTGMQWTLIYQWAKNAGLDVIACVTPRYIDNESKTHFTDPRNIAKLLSFSDRMGYNINWQLGYGKLFAIITNGIR